MRTANRNQINAKVDPVLHHRLETHCKANKVDRSSVMRDALRMFLGFQEGGGDIGELNRQVRELSAKVDELLNDSKGRSVKRLATNTKNRRAK